MKILAIETSCDETSIAVVDGDRLIKSRTYSQIKHHKVWGGVHPSVARRAHEERLPILLNKVVGNDGLNGFDAVAVTVGPGLPPSLEQGVKFAKKLALENNLPLIPVNHLEGHLASLFLKNSQGKYFISALEGVGTKNLFPILNLIVSGGHTELVVSNLVNGKMKHHLLGQTLDDAAGECLDKVGRELGLGYPAGPVLEKMARGGDRNRFTFPLPLRNTTVDDVNFSFSGLKTKAMQVLHGTHAIGSADKRPDLTMDKGDICDFAASFQEAVVEALLFKVKRAVKKTGIKTVMLSGGVAANNQLRARLRACMKDLGGVAYMSDERFTGDNAGMIGLAAQWTAKRGETAKTSTEIEKVDRKPSLGF